MSRNCTTTNGKSSCRLRLRTGVRAAVCAIVVTALWASATTPTWGQGEAETVAWRADECREAALFATTDYADIAPLVPPPFSDNVIKAGLPGAETATLIFTFNRCTNTRVVTDHGAFATDEASEVILGVVLSGSEYSAELIQFYTLVNYVDWEPLATGFKSLGLPTVHVPHLSLSFAGNTFTHLGTITLDVPAPGEHISAVGSMAVLTPPPIDAHAASLGLGPRGVVVVDHHSPIFGVNPGASATITTDRPTGVWAKAMGAMTRRVDGFFLEKGSGHEHSATLVG